MTPKRNLELVLKQVTRAWNELERLGCKDPSDEVLAAMISSDDDGEPLVERLVAELRGIVLSDEDVAAIWGVATKNLELGWRLHSRVGDAVRVRIWLRQIQAQSIEAAHVAQGENA